MEKSIRSAVIIGLVFGLTGCAGMYAEHTEVELYSPVTGKIIGKVFSNKGYDGFTCKGRFDECD